MTAGTVVITGGILATVILLCIIAVLCYCRLQYYCCKKEESESEEEEPDFAVTSRLPPVHSNHNLLAASAASTTANQGLGGVGVGGGLATATANGPAALFTPPVTRKLTRSHTFCPSCTSRHELPFYLQPPEGPLPLRNGGQRLQYRPVQQHDLHVPMEMPMELPLPLPLTHQASLHQPLLQHQASLHHLHPHPLHPVMPTSTKMNLTRSVTMREMFTRSCSISTDV
ncbi:protein FAM163B [Engraulis encrasicolus]|uniref:protein FAM163B n=1 Tax=Engraulis encrasicolus TaxID=184585 RepID=UPI002FD11980